MSTRKRTITRETCLNTVEDDTIKDHLRDIGMAFSTWSRQVIFGAIAAHDALNTRQQESRKCPDAQGVQGTAVASRASIRHARVANPTARHRERARVGFGGAARPIRV